MFSMWFAQSGNQNFDDKKHRQNNTVVRGSEKYVSIISCLLGQSRMVHFLRLLRVMLYLSAWSSHLSSLCYHTCIHVIQTFCPCFGFNTIVVFLAWMFTQVKRPRPCKCSSQCDVMRSIHEEAGWQSAIGRIS